MSKRIINGVVTSIPINSGRYGYHTGSSFLIKLNEDITGVPDEVVVQHDPHSGFYIRPGDNVRIYGKLLHEILKFWNEEYIWIKAEHIYNETLNCGY